MSGFLPSLKPGNVRAPISVDDTFFGLTADTFNYSPSPNQVPIKKINPCSGNSEIAAGVIKIYEPPRFATTDSPNHVVLGSTSTGGQPGALSQLGHNNHLNFHVAVTNGTDSNFRVHYGDSPNADFITLPEGVDYAHNYNYYNMSPNTTQEDEKGTYRQATFRIVHSSANAGNENACFDRIEFCDSSSNEINYTYNSSVDNPPYSEGDPIIDLYIKLTDKSSGSQSCNVGVGYPHSLTLCERIHIENTANRLVKPASELSTSSGAKDFYRGNVSLVDVGDAPYFDVGTDRSGTFRRCHRLHGLNETWADPDRNVIMQSTTKLSQHFFNCDKLKFLPSKYFTCDLDSPNQHLDCEDFGELFYEACAIEHIPKIPMRDFRGNAFYKVSNQGSRVYGMFYGCVNLKKVPEGVHLKDLRVADTNGHSNPSYSGISRMFYNCASLESLGDVRFDDVPLYSENSPDHPYRIAANNTFINVGPNMKVFPYIGSFGILGANIFDGGPTTLNDVQQMMQGFSSDFDRKYLQDGITVAHMSEIFYLFYNSVTAPQEIKLRWINDNPDSTNLTQAVPTGTSGSYDNNKYRLFYAAYNLNTQDNVGWHYWTDNFESDSNTEYFGMYQNCYNLKRITGWVGNKANASSDYSSMFSNVRKLERFHCGGEKVGTFDGGGDYIDTGLPSSTLRPASADTSYTMSAMASIDALSNTEGLGRLIVAADGSSTRGGIEINSEDDGSTGRAHFRIGGTHYASDGTGTGATAVAITTGEKVHVCATVDFTSTNAATINLYVNGVLTHNATGQSMGGAAGSTTVKVGSNGDGTTHYFDGKMYDIRLYDDVLTAAEVKDLADELLYLKYNQTAKEAEKNMILHYDFEDGYGGTDKKTTVIHNKAGKSRFGGSHAQYNGTINGATSAEFWANFDQFGPKFSFNMDYCPLTPAALREIFVNLPTVSSQTFTHRYNAYTSYLTEEDKNIAKDKGWTLTFS